MDRKGHLAKSTEDDTDPLFDVGIPVAAPAVDVPPEPPKPEPPDPTTPMEFEPVAGATISADKLYRYSLWRRLLPVGKGKTILWIGLNPSTADGEQDDPTVRAMLSFSKRWGCGLMVVGNLLAYRSTDPEKLRTVDDARGPENVERLVKMRAMADVCVAAWGNGGAFRRVGRHTFNGLALAGPMMCLGVNKTGHPVHPLYQPRNKELRVFAYGRGEDQSAGAEL
jgi:hypothetical protein